MVNKKLGNFNPSNSNIVQPVRFYKIVALTFLFLTILLLGLITFVSSKRAEITITTRSDTVDAAFSFDVGREVENMPVKATVTSTVVTVSKTFSPKGERQIVSKAGGLVTIYNVSNIQQPLVATTRLLTADGTLFRLKNSTVVPAQGQVEVEVYADKEGDIGDIRTEEFTIPGLNLSRQKEVYAKSDKSLSGGVKTVGVITSSDIQKGTEEVLQELKQAGVDEFQARYDGKKVVSTIAQYAIEPDKKIGVETDSFALVGRATVVAVIFDDKEMNEYANDLLNKQIVDNSEILESTADAPGVTIENFDLEKGTAVVKVLQNGVVNIDPNSKELQKIMFFGKSEDELRRYLLSLNHIQIVEVKFKPFWNSTVPHVADHVKVMVKQTTE